MNKVIINVLNIIAIVCALTSITLELCGGYTPFSMIPINVAVILFILWQTFKEGKLK